MNRRPLDFRDFESLAADVDHLHQGGYTQTGNWDLRQICDHLTTAMRMSLEGFPFKANWFLRTFIGPVARWQILRTRRMPAGFQTPKAMAPAAAGDEKTAVTTFQSMLLWVRDHTGPFQPSPLAGAMSPEQWRQFHLIHAAHHLSFLLPRDGRPEAK